MTRWTSVKYSHTLITYQCETPWHSTAGCLTATWGPLIFLVTLLICHSLTYEFTQPQCFLAASHCFVRPRCPVNVLFYPPPPTQKPHYLRINSQPGTFWLQYPGLTPSLSVTGHSLAFLSLSQWMSRDFLSGRKRYTPSCDPSRHCIRKEKKKKRTPAEPQLWTLGMKWGLGKHMTLL